MARELIASFINDKPGFLTCQSPDGGTREELVLLVCFGLGVTEETDTAVI